MMRARQNLLVILLVGLGVGLTKGRTTAQAAAGLPLSGFAQALASDGASIFELRLEPEFRHNKVPEAFTVSIVNKSDHDITLPMPDQGCADVAYGTIKLHVSHRPSKAGIGPIERGCFSDYGYTPILDRIKGWKVLHPGQSLILMNNFRVAQDTGTYDVWASYIPPGMPKADGEVLQEAGIDFPKSSLESSHMSFVRKR
jgi:hypothetical protein